MHEESKIVIPIKYKIGDNCIFLDLSNLKLYKAHVIAVEAYQDKEVSSVNYTVQRDKRTENGIPIIVSHIPEKTLFRNQTEVYDWAIEVANQTIE